MTLAYSSHSLPLPQVTRSQDRVTTQAGVDGAIVQPTGNAGLSGADSQTERSAYRGATSNNVEGYLQVRERGGGSRPDPCFDEMRKAIMLQPHPTFNLKTYDLARDAAYAAELRAELYGDEYAVVDTVAFGFAVMRVADLDMYGIQPWQVLTSRSADLDPPARRARLNEILRAVTDERVAS